MASSSSRIQSKEIRSGLFKIRWELKEDIIEKGVCGDYVTFDFHTHLCKSSLVLKMLFDYSFPTRKKYRNLKQNLVVKEVSQEELKSDSEEETDEDSFNEDDEEEDNDHEGIAENSNIDAIEGENEPEQQMDTPHPLKHEIPPMHMWILTSEYASGSGSERKLLKNDTDEWRVEWISYKLPDYINLWIDFGTQSQIERNAIKTMSGLATMFYDQHRCDVQFHFKDGKSIGAHILILSVGSPVFSAMFQSGLLESQTREVTITDIELEIFRQLLDYLYTGSAPKLADENITKLLFEAADKYSVENLKSDCLEALQERVRIDNVTNLLVWSHFQAIKPLFEVAVKFTLKNIRKILVQADFEDSLKSYPELFLIVMKRFASLPCRRCTCYQDVTSSSSDSSP